MVYERVSDSSASTKRQAHATGRVNFAVFLDKTRSALFVVAMAVSGLSVYNGASLHRFEEVYSSMRRSFVDGWNVTPSMRCSGSCTG